MYCSELGSRSASVLQSVDCEMTVHKQMLKKEGGLDDRLAEHVAKLFTRDPVPAYEGEFMDD